ncbi:enoyl-CoA hydratase [Kordiimonas sediminis]|uniref:Enoyl-CoA hydratase n=1 Tax=Kordiimonas sediminis TaxID=1735581 RepID=A0A919AWW2_9PROT|nr:enoyl-CoA hydratase-related protein [Kordiimonas sediminis]GHF28827.1 enoyl-CoA hydratase [Kordiimonas sediminis]
MTDLKTITFDIKDGLATITLNVPDKLNALSREMLEEMRKTLNQIAVGAIEARALLITGQGKAFSAGADLSAGNLQDAGTDLMTSYHPFLLELAHLKIPVITAVNGVAAGAGMSLALSADFVVAARSAYFLQAFVNIGLVPDAGSSYILPRLIGEARAREVTMLGEKLPSDKAAEWGMIYKCVEDDALMSEATALANRLANGPTRALSGIRQLIAKSFNQSFTEQIQSEAMIQRDCYFSNDCREGVTAFLQKRKANFTGT